MKRAFLISFIIAGVVIVAIIVTLKIPVGLNTTVGVTRSDGSKESFQGTDKGSKTTSKSTNQDIPVPPGFTLAECANMKAKFLNPDGWYKTEFQEPNETEQKCFITKNDFSKTKKLNTGLLVVATKEADKKLKMNIKDIVYQFIQEKISLKYPQYNISETVLEPFYIRTIQIKENNQVSYISAIGNKASGTFYTLTYTTPENDFLDDIKQGFPLSGPMTRQFNLDDAY